MNTPFIDSSPSGLADSTTFKAANSEKSDTRADKHIWGIFLFLCLISIVELYSASSREVALSPFGVYGPVVRHGGMLIAGVCIVYLLQKSALSQLSALGAYICSCIGDHDGLCDDQW